jgi:DNA-binding NtrC family response regulator
MRICKVLIVEDDEHVRHLLAEAFAADGFEFSLAGSAAQMRAALAAEPFDIVVIDLLLPGGDDGFALADEARALGCAVILTTGDHRRETAIRSSGHRYLLKPFPMRQLTELALQILDEAEATCTRRSLDPPAPVAIPV